MLVKQRKEQHEGGKERGREDEEKKKPYSRIRFSKSTDREFLHLTMSYQWSSDTFSLGSSLGSEADRLGCKLIVCLYGTCSPK